MAINTLPLAADLVAVLGQVVPRMKQDDDGNEFHATDNDGRSLYTVNAVIKNSRGGFEAINVTVPTDDKGKVPGAGLPELTPVRFQGLEAGFYTSERGGGWYFRAAGLSPVQRAAQA